MCLKSSLLVRTYKSFVEGQNNFRIIWSWIFNYTLCIQVLLILMILLSTLLTVECIHLNLTITRARIMILTHPAYFWLIINFTYAYVYSSWTRQRGGLSKKSAWRLCNPVALRNNIYITQTENVIRSVTKNFLWPFLGSMFRSQTARYGRIYSVFLVSWHVFWRSK